MIVGSALESLYMESDMLGRCYFVIRLNFFLICHLFCNAVLVSIIKESLCTCSVGGMIPGTENLSTRRNEDFFYLKADCVHRLEAFLRSL
jgi:hypothetical protein